MASQHRLAAERKSPLERGFKTLHAKIPSWRGVARSDGVCRRVIGDSEISALGVVALALGAFVFTGCRTVPSKASVPGPGDEIIMAGQRFHTGTRVITWMEPGGYNAYHGILGHFHLQENKTDHGPALQWRKLIEDARQQVK
jgi:hypothetical protein